MDEFIVFVWSRAPFVRGQTTHLQMDKHGVIFDPEFCRNKLSKSEVGLFDENRLCSAAFRKF